MPPTPHRLRNSHLILILGALSTVSPFAIDMYLPAFSQMAEALQTTPGQIAWSLSTYFVGFAIGQLFYGPLLDRFGRKRPVYVGLLLFITASMGCLSSRTIEALLVFRFVQALGGCVAGVASMAMVRDFFPLKEGAKVFSLLLLVIGVSPLLAPTVGGFVVATLGWQWVFVFLALIVAILLAICFFVLPEGHAPDPSVQLRVGPILRGYWQVLREPIFYTYAFAGAFAFAGLFVYVAGSPIIFMQSFGVSAQVYGLIFAFLSVGFIGASQVNLLLLRRFENERIFRAALTAQVLVGLFFWFGTGQGWFGLMGTVGMLFASLACMGLSNPNGAALALGPFTANAGRASALLGFLQIGTGALASAAVGFFSRWGSSPVTGIVAILCAAPMIGWTMLWLGQRRIVFFQNKQRESRE